jgi:hypothetical protein
VRRRFGHALVRAGPGADSAATRALWERYFPQLVRLARKELELRGAPRRAADEEDVAASVMESLFRAAEEGRLPDLADRDDLWRLLLRMTARKVVDLKRHEARQRRGGGRVRGESALGGAGSPGQPGRLGRCHRRRSYARVRRDDS